VNSKNDNAPASGTYNVVVLVVFTGRTIVLKMKTQLSTTSSTKNDDYEYCYYCYYTTTITTTTTKTTTKTTTTTIHNNYFLQSIVPLTFLSE
jgi:hypothetical protein